MNSGHDALPESMLAVDDRDSAFAQIHVMQCAVYDARCRVDEAAGMLPLAMLKYIHIW